MFFKDQRFQAPEKNIKIYCLKISTSVSLVSQDVLSSSWSVNHGEVMGWEDLRVHSREQVNTHPVDVTDGKSHGKYQVDNTWKNYLAGPCSSYVMLLVMFVYSSVQDVEYGSGPQNSGN